ncbi:hypothetical protein X976_4843 [Burkholderia pseudomallei MSHR7500]|nr:hypothetical protein X976_4843 [Burkholderia pseudomallei MSHR7500]
MRHRRVRQGDCPFPRRYRLATRQASHSGYLDGEPLWPATQWLTLPQCPGCFDAGHFRYMNAHQRQVDRLLLGIIWRSHSGCCREDSAASEFQYLTGKNHAGVVAFRYRNGTLPASHVRLDSERLARQSRVLSNCNGAPAGPCNRSRASRTDGKHLE